MIFPNKIFVVQSIVICLMNQADALAQNMTGQLPGDTVHPGISKATTGENQASLEHKLRDLLLQQKYKQSIPYFEEQLELMERLHGGTSPEVINCSYEFSLVLNKAGEFDRAAQLQAKAASLLSARDAAEQGEGDPSPKTGRGVIGGGDSSYRHPRQVGNIRDYREKLVETLSDKWHPKIILPLTVQLLIKQNGDLMHYNLMQSSGNQAVDSYTLKLIRDTKFPPLPEWIHSDHLTVSFELPRRR